MAVATIQVIGMSCTGCASSVERALKCVHGVQNAIVDLKEEQATITFDIGVATIEDLKRAIEDTGYETSEKFE